MGDTTAFVLAGLPGCGKSTAASIIEQVIEQEFNEGAVSTEVSDYVRSEFETTFDGASCDDNELGRWAADMKEKHGNDYFVRNIAEMFSESDKHVIISGVRSPEEAGAVRDVYGEDNTVVIAIWTLPDVRFERKYGAIPSEDHPKYEEFKERNEREIHDWRCVEFFASTLFSDYIVQNNGSLGAFEHDLDVITVTEIDDDLEKPKKWTEDWYPFPEGLSTEQIASYL